jgi:predicted acyl esterase
MNDTPPEGMVIDRDVPITMDDGIVVRADVYRPDKPGRYAVLLSYGPYGKGLSYQEAYAPFWQVMVDEFPEVLEGSSNRYQAWETVDPEKWVPDGYVCIRVDSRGAGTSPGVLDLYSAREAQDLYHCIEWAGAQTWSNGKVGLTGISYYAINQWQVAGLQPPHLAAMCVWEGASDFYRDCYRHGGILSDIAAGPWYRGQILGVQHGKGENGKRNPLTGALVSGPETFDEETLRANRAELPDQLLQHRFDDEYYRSRLPNFDKIKVPLLSAANWGGAGIHLRGNIEGYLSAGTKNKWLEVHGNNHVAPFYLDSSIAFQKRFFGQFLKGEDTGWDQQPPVDLKIRHPGERFVSRAEQEWPLARTDWQRYYLRPDLTLGREALAGAPLSYDTTGQGLTFLMPAFGEDLEITGPLASKLFVSSRTIDADIFAVFRLFDSAGVETLFIGANDSAQPLTLGWLRASHRQLDPDRSLPYRPYHAHLKAEPLVPGEIAELEVELWPTSIVVPKGHRLGLTIRGKDYENAPHYLPQSPATMRGVSLLSHTSKEDRPAEVFDTVNTLHFDAGRAPYLLLPVIPTRSEDTPIDWFAHLRGDPLREGS